MMNYDGLYEIDGLNPNGKSMVLTGIQVEKPLENGWENRIWKLLSIWRIGNDTKSIGMKRIFRERLGEERGFIWFYGYVTVKRTLVSICGLCD